MKKRLRILLCSASAVMLTAVISITVANITIAHYAQYTFDNISELQPAYCAILLGTSKWLKGGKLNLYYQYRILSTLELYKKEKCKKIIVSGDNGTLQYNEPMMMKRDLIKLGVRETDIICDYAGFRTLDSILRFREIFGQNKGIVISQKFHTTRAVYIGRAYGIELYGLNARDVDVYYGVKTRLREIFSKAVCLLDVEIFHTQPRYLGERIQI